MARLPTDADLGGLPSAESGRPVSSVDTTSIGSGMAAFGQGVSNLGTGIGSMARQQAAQVNDLENAKAKSDWLTKKVNLDSERESISDPDQLKAFDGRYQAALNSSAGLIGDARKRERFLVDHRPQLAQSNASVATQTRGLVRDRTIATTQTDLDSLQNAGLKATDEKTKAEVLDAGSQRIDALAHEGYISQQQAVALKKQFGDGYRVKVLQAMPAGERLQALRPINADAGARTAVDFFKSKGWTPEQAAAIAGGLFVESRFNPGAVNPGDGADGSDSLGIGQWNAGRAKALKAFAAAKGKPYNDFQTQLEFVQHELETSEGKAAQKLRAATTVDDAATAFLHYERPKGFEGGLATASNGANRLRAARAYHGQLSGSGSGQRESMIAAGLPEDQKRIMADQAEAQIRQEERQAEIGRKQDLAKLTTDITDDLASVERTGQGLPPDRLTGDRIEQLAGEDARRQWDLERGRAYRIHEALDGIETLPEGEVERRLQKLEPKAGAEGFADDMKAYDRARAKADKFLNARRADPALASEAYPSVKEARQAAEYEDINGVRSITPSSAQNIIRSRLAAQGQLGIQEPMAVTKSEAAVIARQMRAIGEENPDQMRKFMEGLTRTYGEYSDEVLASAIQHQNVNRDLSVMATQILGKVSQGIMPTTSDMKKAESLIDAQSLSSIMPPPPLPQELRGRRDAFGAAQQRLIRQQAEQDAMEAARRGQVGDPTLATADGVSDIKRLIADPSLATEFDIKYNKGGPGIAQRVLEDYRRRTGIQPNG